MKDIIINQPHLLSFKQKCGSWLLTVISWLLWLYFLLPLFTLGGWLLGVKNLADEIRWYGGYKTLLEMLELYGECIIAIAILWLLWTAYLVWRSSKRIVKAASPISTGQLASSFGISEQQLQTARLEKKLTVYFDDNANITAIDGAKQQTTR